MNNGTLPSLIDTMKGLLATAEIQVADAQAALDRAKADVRQLQNMLKAAGWLPPEETKPKPSPKPKAAVSGDVRSKVLAAIIAWEKGGNAAIPDVRGSFTAAQVKGDFHETSARAALQEFREEGVIRAAGLVPNTQGRAPLAYVLVSDDVMSSPEAKALAGLAR